MRFLDTEEMVNGGFFGDIPTRGLNLPQEVLEKIYHKMPFISIQNLERLWLIYGSKVVCVKLNHHVPQLCGYFGNYLNIFV